MISSDPHGLGYHDVDGDSHTEVLVENMDATAGWGATRRLRAWERGQLGLVPGERILDVGCGRGEAVLVLAQDLGRAGAVVGVDASDAMLDVARRGTSNVACPVRFSVGDARSLDEPDGSFDAVRCERTLQWIQEPAEVVSELVRAVRPGGRLSLVDTDWSTLRIEVGNSAIATAVSNGLRIERNRPSNVGARLADLAIAAGCDVLATTTDTQVWTRWDPDESAAPDGCFSMASLADDFVEKGHLESDEVSRFVGDIHAAARGGRFTMSLKMHAVIASRP